MNTRLDRMIKRARAPLSALQPVVASVLSPEPPLREDVRESLDGQPISRNHPVVEVAGGAPSRSAQTEPVVSHQQILFSGEQSGENLSVPQLLETSHVQQSASLAENKSSLSQDDVSLRRDTLAAPRTADEPEVYASSISDDPRLVARIGSQAASEPKPRSELRESNAAQTSNDVAARFEPAKEGLLPHAPTAEPVESLIEVNVSIGSIDFRPARPAEPMKLAESHPRVTLDSYLQRGKRDAR